MAESDPATQPLPTSNTRLNNETPPEWVTITQGHLGEISESLVELKLLYHREMDEIDVCLREHMLKDLQVLAKHVSHFMLFGKPEKIVGLSFTFLNMKAYSDVCIHYTIHILSLISFLELAELLRVYYVDKFKNITYTDYQAGSKQNKMLQMLLEYAPSVNVTHPGHFFAFDEALERLRGKLGSVKKRSDVDLLMNVFSSDNLSETLTGATEGNPTGYEKLFFAIAMTKG
ncbi:1137_t:CDS:2 [Paraglomus occultum]|uniref:1137_t:CDS:1 n=1 Tax=Paraglomus occultum TaxID=144539 RepID=A0A9N9BP51_9GLOM|nr:1137_t:CDS:2 [Paraglomus occultum]